MLDIDRYHPMKGHVLAEIELLPETTASGIFVPPDARIQLAQNKTAVVRRIHPSFTDEHGVQPGDRVLLSNFVSEQHPDPRNLRLIFIRDDDVLGVVVESCEAGL